MNKFQKKVNKEVEKYISDYDIIELIDRNNVSYLCYEKPEGGAIIFSKRNLKKAMRKAVKEDTKDLDLKTGFISKEIFEDIICAGIVIEDVLLGYIVGIAIVLGKKGRKEAGYVC